MRERVRVRVREVIFSEQKVEAENCHPSYRTPNQIPPG
jgi:hypothetical protein